MKQYKLQIYKDKQSEYRWRLKAGNGKIVADGGEGYKTKAKLLKTLSNIGIEMLRITTQ